MARRLRFQPEPRLLFEITTRCLGGQILLRPSKLVNDIIGGVFGWAAQLYGEMEVETARDGLGSGYAQLARSL